VKHPLEIIRERNEISEKLQVGLSPKSDFK